jgi:hypothetical protein
MDSIFVQEAAARAQDNIQVGHLLSRLKRAPALEAASRHQAALRLPTRVGAALLRF